MKNTKKGFTLVELLVVIAILAILATVSVVSYTSYIEKANQSVDEQAVVQMNKLLMLEADMSTLEEAINLLEYNGINAGDTLVPISKNHSYYWYKTYNVILLVNTESNSVVYPDDEKYSKDFATDLAKTGDEQVLYDLRDGIKYIDVVVNSVDDIVDALANGIQNIILKNDITIERDIYVTGENVTIDLDGHTFNSVQNSNGRSTVIYIRENASLTVTNGTLNVRSLQNYGDLTIKSDVVINAMDTTGGGCIRNKSGGNVVIEGGTFNVVNHIEWDYINYGGAAGVHNDGGTVTIKDGVFNSATDAYLIINENGGNMKIEGGTFTAYRGALCTKNAETVVDGGTFAVTADSYSGWTVYHEGTGSTTLNGGEYSHVVEGREFVGCSFEKQ